MEPSGKNVFLIFYEMELARPIVKKILILYNPNLNLEKMSDIFSRKKTLL